MTQLRLFPESEPEVEEIVWLYPICEHDWDTSKRSRELKLPTANRCRRCMLLLGEFDEPRAQPVVAAMCVDEARHRGMEPTFIALLERIHRAALERAAAVLDVQASPEPSDAL